MQEHLTLHELAYYLSYLFKTQAPDATMRTAVHESLDGRALRCVRCREVRQGIRGFLAHEYQERDPAVDSNLYSIRWNIECVMQHLLARGLHFRRCDVTVEHRDGSFNVAIGWNAGRSYASVERYLNRSPIANLVRFSLWRTPSELERLCAVRKLAPHFGVQEAAMQVADESCYYVQRDEAARTWTNWVVRMVNERVLPSAITLPEVETLLKSEHPGFRELGIAALAKVDLSSAVPSPDPIASAPGSSFTC